LVDAHIHRVLVVVDQGQPWEMVTSTDIPATGARRPGLCSPHLGEFAMPDERRTQHATLGCGTLILIALIVLFFSRPGISDVERDVRLLRTEVGDLKKAVESQTREMKSLQEKIDRLRQGGEVKPGGKE
jgi:hypothetical protein